MGSGRIPIGAARKMSEQYDVPMIVLYAIHPNGKEFTVTTYGATKKLCRHAADIGKKLAKAIMDAEVVPAEVEPMDVPDAPTIMRSAP